MAHSSRPRATFSKLCRKILGRFLILGKSWENIWQSTSLKLRNYTAIIPEINTLIFWHRVGRYYVDVIC